MLHEWSLGMCKEEVGPRSYLVEVTTQSRPDAEIEDTLSESGDA